MNYYYMEHYMGHYMCITCGVADKNPFVWTETNARNARNCSTNEHNITHYGKNYAYYGNSFLFLPAAKHEFP